MYINGVTIEVDNNKFVKNGNWDSIHVVEVHELGGNKASYKLTSTVMLDMNVDKQEVGHTLLSGSLTRQTEVTQEVNEVRTHIANIGRLIEDMETDMRSNLNELYVLKTREIVNTIHSVKEGPVQSATHVASLNAAVSVHGKTRKVDSEV